MPKVRPPGYSYNPREFEVGTELQRRLTALVATKKAPEPFKPQDFLEMASIISAARSVLIDNAKAPHTGALLKHLSDIAAQTETLLSRLQLGGNVDPEAEVHLKRAGRTALDRQLYEEARREWCSTLREYRSGLRMVLTVKKERERRYRNRHRSDEGLAAWRQAPRPLAKPRRPAAGLTRYDHFFPLLDRSLRILNAAATNARATMEHVPVLPKSDVEHFDLALRQLEVVLARRGVPIGNSAKAQLAMVAHALFAELLPEAGATEDALKERLRQRRKQTSARDVYKWVSQNPKTAGF